MDYADTHVIISSAKRLNATHVTVDINEGDGLKFTLAEALQSWEDLAPGEAFEIRAIHWKKEDDERECSRCGDEVQYLNSEDECLGCEAATRCPNCGDDLDEEDGRERFKNWCTSCVHDAERCGA